MLTIPSYKLQNEFAEISNMIKGREPVVITQYQRPTMLVLSYEEGMEMMRLAAKMRFIQRLDQRANEMPEATEEEMQAISQLIEEEREAISQEKLSKNEPK